MPDGTKQQPQTEHLGRSREPGHNLTTPRVLSVVLIDPHALVAAGLARLVGADPGLRVAGIGTDVDNAVGLVTELHPDVIVLDEMLGLHSGMDQAVALKAIHAPLRVILLSSSDDPRTLARALIHQCDGYVPKSASTQDLLDAIHGASGPVQHLNPDQLRTVIDVLIAPRPPKRGLSRRELEVLTLLAHGASVADIGAQLYIGANTVRSHVHRILRKFDAHSKLEAVTKAMDEDVISAPHTHPNR